jgi:hypothetical protein
MDLLIRDRSGSVIIPLDVVDENNLFKRVASRIALRENNIREKENFKE